MYAVLTGLTTQNDQDWTELLLRRIAASGMVAAPPHKTQHAQIVHNEHNPDIA